MKKSYCHPPIFIIPVASSFAGFEIVLYGNVYRTICHVFLSLFTYTYNRFTTSLRNENFDNGLIHTGLKRHIPIDPNCFPNHCVFL